MRKDSVYLNELGIICALGDNHTTIRDHFSAAQPRTLTHTEQFTPGQQLPLGIVNDPLPPLNTLPKQHRTRCNQLLLAALAQITDALEHRRAAIDPLRIGIVLGTSTSGIAEGEAAITALRVSGKLPSNFDYTQQELSAPAQCLAQWLDIKGPAYTISTACSSSAKALASARRLLRMNMCDLVIAGGVDALCGLTVNGFSALESVSQNVCQPFSRTRDGINIGEGCALFLVSKIPTGAALCGVGESSDAYHMSAPDPEGKGAITAMSLALDDASLSSEDIGYLNLHGTATRQNDKMEATAVQHVFDRQVPCSSTKPYTGHTLGAGAIEAGICWLTMMADKTATRLPVHQWDGQQDPDLAPLGLITPNTTVETLNYTMSNSFAFGGNNISLILGISSEA